MIILGSMKIAGIDVGSNAIRLIIGERDSLGAIHILDKVREPLRLGKDVFSRGEIRRKTQDRMIAAFKKFKKVIDHQQVDFVFAVGTSALREASNGGKVCTEIKIATGIDLKAIGGSREAELVHCAIQSKINNELGAIGLIDIGGGSVEVGFSESSVLKNRQSFPLGTVRLLQIINENDWNESHLEDFLDHEMDKVFKYVDEKAPTLPIEIAVGTGGNMECMGRLRVVLLKKPSFYEIFTEEVEEILNHIKNMSIKDRVQYLRLRPDRADVIFPALCVTHRLLRKMGAKKLCLPNVGLKEGLLYEGFNLYDRKDDSGELQEFNSLLNS